MRSRNTASTTSATTFDFSFLTVQDSNNNDRGALGAGWNLNPDNTDLHNAGTDKNNGLMVGLRYDDNNTAGTSDDFYQLGYMTEFTGAAIIDFTGSDVTFAAPATASWYSMSFDLNFNDVIDEWTVSDWSILDGTSTEVASLLSATFTIQASQLDGVTESALDTATSANTILAGWGNKNGINGFDNVAVTQVPEPTTGLLLLGAGVLAVAGRRHRPSAQ